MLVLTRKLNQQIRLGEDITITILRVRGNTIRLGIEAPRSTRVVRAELPPHDAPADSRETTPRPRPASTVPNASQAPSTRQAARRRVADMLEPSTPSAKPLGQFVGARLTAETDPILT